MTWLKPHCLSYLVVIRLVRCFNLIDCSLSSNAIFFILSSSSLIQSRIDRIYFTIAWVACSVGSSAMHVFHQHCKRMRIIYSHSHGVVRMWCTSSFHHLDPNHWLPSWRLMATSYIAVASLFFSILLSFRRMAFSHWSYESWMERSWHVYDPSMPSIIVVHLPGLLILPCCAPRNTSFSTGVMVLRSFVWTGTHSSLSLSLSLSLKITKLRSKFWC